MRVLSVFLTLVIIFSFSSCTSFIYREAYPTLNDGKYDTEFPYRGCAKQLEEVSESIKLINCIAYYKTYYFAPESKLHTSDITPENIKKYAVKMEMMDNSTSGTATVIFSRYKQAAVLTCAHVVNNPDTVYGYFKDAAGGTTAFVQSVAVKEKQDNYISDFPEGKDLTILKMDTRLDVAVLGTEFNEPINNKIKVINYPFGAAKNLEWGTFVYIFGYPMGYKMLTKGLVSSPNRDQYGGFILDAVFNRGFSGGIVLAIKDGIPNFEIVGLIKAIIAENEYVIKPPREFSSDEYNPLIPYSGDLFVEKKTNIKYGLTKAVPIEQIRQFFDENEAFFESKGYYFRDITTPVVNKQ